MTCSIALWSKIVCLYDACHSAHIERVTSADSNARRSLHRGSCNAWDAQGLGIDIGAVALFAFLVRRDLAARDKQMARMLREEKLGALQLELANRKVDVM